MDLYLFDEGDEDTLTLHFPDQPGSMMSQCARFFTEDDLYLPDEDTVTSDLCPQCQEGWIEVQTTNKEGWVLPS